MNIETNEIIRICSLCGKEYKDNQVIINKCPTQKYSVCLECREKQCSLSGKIPPTIGEVELN